MCRLDAIIFNVRPGQGAGARGWGKSRGSPLQICINRLSSSLPKKKMIIINLLRIIFKGTLDNYDICIFISNSIEDFKLKQYKIFS